MKSNSAEKGSSFQLWPLIVVLGQMIAGMRAEHHYLALPKVLPEDTVDASLEDDTLPGISVIIPARNEERNLPRLLKSLLEQNYLRYEVIVVDDASTDHTTTVVEHFIERDGTGKIHLIQSDGPPTGWTGKNHACWIGANESTYPWLLFIDADVQVMPLALRSSVLFAQRQSVSALSLFAQQRCETLWERLLLPFAYQQYFVGVDPLRVNTISGPALANGQYFLIERGAYQLADGHRANAGSLIDDVALATRLKQVGILSLACRGEQLLTVRMYSNLLGILHGFGKNSYLFLRQSPMTGLQTAISTSLAASVLPLFIDAWGEKSRSLLRLAGVAYIAQILHMCSWSKRFGVPVFYALLTPIAALVFLGIALSSMARVLTRRSFVWKGRHYRSVATRVEERVHSRFSRQWVMDMGRAIFSKMLRSFSNL